MKYTILFEKFECLFNMVRTSNVYIAFLVILVLISSLFFVKKIKNNKVVVLMLISYLVLFIITILNNYSELGKVFDSISTNLFKNIYFPSTYTYLFVMLVMDVVTLISLLNIKVEKIYKVVNGVAFFGMKFILALIMEVVALNKIDIFSKESLFGNTSLVILLELSINIFITWLIVLVIIYLSNKVTELITINKMDKKFINEGISLNAGVDLLANSDEDLGDLQEDVDDTLLEKPVFVNCVDSTSLQCDEVFEVNNMEDDSSSLVDNKIDSNILFDRLLNNGLPVIRESGVVDNEFAKKEEVSSSLNSTSDVVSDNYTLNDYRIFNKILNDIKEFNDNNVVSIDPYLELKLKAKYTAEKYYLFREMLKNSSN